MATFEINPLLWDVAAHDGVSQITLRIGTHTITTGPSDVPANATYDGLIVDPGNVQRSVFPGNATNGKGSVDFGVIELANTGELDPWINYGWGRQAVLKTITAVGQPIAGAQELLRITVIGIESADAVRLLRLRLRGRMTELEEPFLTDRYLGTTDQLFAADVAEGDTDLKGQLKPRIYGTVVNVRAHVVNPFGLIYQFAANAQSQMRIYDGGLELPVQADYSSLNALRDATVSAGFCATCLAQGSVKLGAVPAFEVTADVWEDPGYASGTHSAARVIQRMLEAFGIDNADLDLTSFDDFHNFNPAELGIYIDSDRSLLDVISDVADSVGGAIIDTSDGLFKMVWLTEPIEGDIFVPPVPTGDIAFQTNAFQSDAFQIEAGAIELPPIESATVAASYTQRDLLDQGGAMQLSAGPGDEGDGVPAYAVTVRWGKVWQAQSAGDLAGLVSETDLARKQLLAGDIREINVSDPTILIQHPLAVTLVFETFLANEGDAANEAARRLALYSVRRDRLTFPMSFADDSTRGDVELGRSVKVTMNRFGYGAGKNFVVIGRRDDFKTKVRTLTLWG
jgi:hypothetical protein